jgi:hypothetical protein
MPVTQLAQSVRKIGCKSSKGTLKVKGYTETGKRFSAGEKRYPAVQEMSTI